MPQLHGDHSRQLDLAALCGEVRPEMDLYRAAEGNTCSMEDVSQSGEHGSGGGIGCGDHAGQAELFQTGVVQQVFSGLQRGADQRRIGQSEPALAALPMQSPPQSEAALKDGCAAGEFSLRMAVEYQRTLQGNICKIESKTDQRCSSHNHNFNPSCRILHNCKDIFSKLTRIIHFYYGADVL